MTTSERKKELEEREMERICETCKYEEDSLWEEPCRSCEIGPNQNWEPKDELD